MFFRPGYERKCEAGLTGLRQKKNYQQGVVKMLITSIVFFS